MRIVKLVAVIAIAMTLMAITAALWPSPIATANTAVADGGIIKPVKSQRMISGTNYMATDPLSEFVSSAFYIGDFGLAQYQVKVEIADDEILGPRVITWTPQFSLQPIASGATCDSVSTWFDGSMYQQIYLDGVPVVWDPLPVGARTIGSESVGFEVQAIGHCTRMKIVIGATNVIITTTVDGRWINRQ